MRFEGIRRPPRELSLTPLIDIVFLLLVFFMLTAHFVKDEGIAIQLPQAESAVARKNDEAVDVVLDAKGQIHFAGRILEAGELEEALRRALLEHRRKWVTLRGDREADLGRAVTVLDAARKAGAENVDVITEHP